MSLRTQSIALDRELLALTTFNLRSRVKFSLFEEVDNRLRALSQFPQVLIVLLQERKGYKA
jgi:hypothetical protein